MQLKESKFFLKNYPHQTGVQVTGKEYEITITSLSGKFRNLQRLKAENESSRETAVLILSKIKSESEALSLAQDVKNLLQLACAHRVIFDRQEYVYEMKPITIHKKMSDNISFGYQIIHEQDLNQFLSESLDNWSNLNIAEKDALSASINYLNQTYEDFIDDRILKTVQAWESIANFWKIENDLDPEMLDLRNRVLSAYKQWRKENPLKDPSGQIGSSLARSIDQQKLITRLENLAHKYNLDTEKINLDFKRLIPLRDNVAHDARIDQKGSEVIDLMESAIKGLQIVILVSLGYKGKVIPNTVGIPERNDISEFLKQPVIST